jgi:hypothetical protein
MSHPELSRLLQQARTSEMLRHAAAHRRAAVDPPPASAGPTVTLRLAGPDDARALRWLAELDSAPPLPEPALIGEAAGRLVAALSLADGRVIANPYEHTVAVVELLRARARQLSRGDMRTRFRRVTLRRGLLRPGVG